MSGGRGRWPEHVDGGLDELLARMGAVVVQDFGDRQDSRATLVGVEADGGGRFVVKHAVDPEAIGWLESGVRFHAAVRHPVIVPFVHRAETRDGVAVVMPWADGVPLVDGYNPAVPGRDEPGSPYRRFLALPADELGDALQQLMDAHVAVAAAGFVAVDLYDGSLLYDFDARALSLVDLEMYRPGPYVLDLDRQYGSSTYMAPEEWQRGATIDERTMVFTLGRFALVLLGRDRKGPAVRGDFRGSDGQFAVATAACRDDPSARIPAVAELARRWRAAARA